MSEHESEDQLLAAQLSRFTPDCGVLDRDVLIFAAGRASANKRRGWRVIAGTLAASQLLTLCVLWPRAAENRLLPIANTALASNLAANTEPAQSGRIETSPFQVMKLQHELLATDRALAPQRLEGPIVPDDAPLRAFSRVPAGLQN